MVVPRPDSVRRWTGTLRMRPHRSAPRVSMATPCASRSDVTTIGEMGEDALLDLFAPRLPGTDAALLGPGDDAAVLSVDGDLVVSSDVLIERRHFRREWDTAADVGWRAAMQNLSLIHI